MPSNSWVEGGGAKFYYLTGFLYCQVSPPSDYCYF